MSVCKTLVDLHGVSQRLTRMVSMAIHIHKEADSFHHTANTIASNLVKCGITGFVLKKSQLDNNECHAVQKTIRSIKSLSAVPLFQAIMSSAIHNEHLEWNSEDTDIINSHNKRPSVALTKNMLMQKQVKPVEDGTQAVADALFDVMGRFGFPCGMMGKAQRVGEDSGFDLDLCKGDPKPDGYAEFTEAYDPASAGCWVSFGCISVVLSFVGAYILAF